MPTLPRSPAMSIHSWSFVYFNAVGYAISLSTTEDTEDAELSLVERQPDHAGAGTAATNIDLELAARCSMGEGQICHPDGLLDRQRLRAAGHRAHGRPGHVD